MPLRIEARIASVPIATKTAMNATSTPCSRDGLAQVRRIEEPKARASIAVASFPARRIARTRSANACPGKRRSRPRSAMPRARRACPSDRQSSKKSPTSRSAASAPSTNRDGRRSTWASESANSVGSTVAKRTMAGTPIARMRISVAIASVTEPSVITTANQWNHTRPDASP